MKKLILLSSIVIIILCLQACRKSNNVSQDSDKEFKLAKESIFVQEKEGGADVAAPSLENIPVEKVSKEELVADLQKEEESSKREYENFLDIQYEFLEYAGRDIISMLKEIYAKFDFSCEFKIGDEEKNKLYVEKFFEFFNNKIPYYSIETEKKNYCKDVFPQIEENIQECTFFLFDVDEDGSTELGVASPNFPRCEYIFKYDEEQDVVFLWKDIKSYTLRGSRTISWEWDGIRFAFYRLDENGKEVSSIFFYIKADQEEPIFMVGTPSYNGDKMLLEKEVAEQAFYDISNKCYLFKVTEKEWNEITIPFFEMMKNTCKSIDEITYTYDELFEAL